MPSPVRALSAVTLGTHDMARAVAFYEALGFVGRCGDKGFASPDGHEISLAKPL